MGNVFNSLDYVGLIIEDAKKLFEDNDLINAEAKFFEAQEANENSIKNLRSIGVEHPANHTSIGFYIKNSIAICHIAKCELNKASHELTEVINGCCNFLDYSHDEIIATPLVDAVIFYGNVISKNNKDISVNVFEVYLRAFKSISSLDFSKMSIELIGKIVNIVKSACFALNNFDSFDRVFFVLPCLSIINQAENTLSIVLETYRNYFFNFASTCFNDFCGIELIKVEYSRRVKIGEELNLFFKYAYSKDPQICYLSMRQKIHFGVCEFCLENGDNKKYCANLIEGWRINEIAFVEHNEPAVLNLLSKRVANDVARLRELGFDSEIEEIYDICSALHISRL